jgi:hypothetical protein
MRDHAGDEYPDPADFRRGESLSGSAHGSGIGEPTAQQGATADAEAGNADAEITESMTRMSRNAPTARGRIGFRISVR